MGAVESELMLPVKAGGDSRASHWGRGMWHQSKKNLPSHWILASASVSLSVLICEMGVLTVMTTKGGLRPSLVVLGLCKQHLHQGWE